MKELILAELIRLNNNLEKKPHSKDYLLEVKKRMNDLQNKNKKIEKQKRENNRAHAERIGKIIEKAEKEKQ